MIAKAGFHDREDFGTPSRTKSFVIMKTCSNKSQILASRYARKVFA